MKRLLTLIFTLTMITTAMAKGDKVMYKDKTIETPDVSISIENAVATEAYSKFKIRIKNKTNDVLVFKPQELVFVIDGKEYSAIQEKTLTIGPSDEGTKVVDLKGGGFTVNNYSLKVGSIYKAKAIGSPLSVPNFKLPASANDFTIGGFKCTMKKQVRRTDVTEVSFDCNYTGSHIGFVNPGKISLKMPNGREYANMHHSRHPLMLAKGETDDFALVWKKIPVSDGDMQFVDMQILFGQAFTEASLIKLSEQVIQMEKE